MSELNTDFNRLEELVAQTSADLANPNSFIVKGTPIDVTPTKVSFLNKITESIPRYRVKYPLILHEQTMRGRERVNSATEIGSILYEEGDFLSSHNRFGHYYSIIFTFSHPLKLKGGEVGSRYQIEIYNDSIDTARFQPIQIERVTFMRYFWRTIRTIGVSPEVYDL